MIKQIIALVGAMTLALPVQASNITSHYPILTSLNRKGVRLEINPKECNPYLDGFYHHVMGITRVGVCQDLGTPGGPEVQWTANDLDTLRHESFHLIQDCIVDGETNMALHPFFDGDGPGPATIDIDKVIDELGADKAFNIWEKYARRGAGAEEIIMEIEAFSVARYVAPGDIAAMINKFCKR